MLGQNTNVTNPVMKNITEYKLCIYIIQYLFFSLVLSSPILAHVEHI